MANFPISNVLTLSPNFNLAPGEKVLWSGSPQQGIVFQGLDLLFIPFSILWTGFACFWEYHVIQVHAPILFMLWGIPFVLVGLYITVGRFLFDAWRRQQIMYMVTSERVIISSRLLEEKMTSLDLRNLHHMSLERMTGDRGTIFLGATDFSAALYTWIVLGIWRVWPRVVLPPTLERIDNAKQVYTLIRKGQEAPPSQR